MGLLERDSYLELLAGALERACAGSGRIALVCGEAGIGKTTLIREFVGRQKSAPRVLWGGCEALFTPHPLAPLYDIAREAGDDFRNALAGATSREAIFNTALDQLARGRLATVLIFEDVHWADEATLDLLKYLGRRLQRLNVLLVLSYRDDEIGWHHPLRSVLGDLPADSTHRLVLPPLTEGAVAMLAGNAGHQSSGLHAATGGNPFFVTEALAISAGEVPATVRDAVMARMARLSRGARELANVASLVPGKAERWLLEKVVALEASALDECLRGGMVSHPDGSLSFRHELARRAVEESLPPGLQQDFHARILRAILGSSDYESHLERVIHHADKAGDGASVLKFAPIAARSAAALGAHREAAAHFDTALRHAGTLPGPGRAELLDGFSYACYLTDRVKESVAAAERSLALWRESGNQVKEGDRQRWLSRLSWFDGRREDAERYAAQAIQTLEPLPQCHELAMALSNRAQLHMLAGECPEAIRSGLKAVELARQLGDLEVESHALNNVGTSRLQMGDRQGIADLEQSLRLALEGGYQEHAARAYTNLSTQTVHSDRDYVRGRKLLGEGLAFCEARDLDAWERYMSAWRAEVSLAEGKWNAASEDAEAVMRQHEVAPVTRIVALTVLARLRARRGDPGADTALDDAQRLAEKTAELQRMGAVAIARAEFAWLNGTLQDAVGYVRKCYEMARRVTDPWVLGELAFWLWEADALEGEAPPGIPEVLRLQMAGEWSAAATIWEKMGCPYHRAVALAETDSESDLRTALEIAEQLGAAPLAGMVRRRLRASGVRKIPRGAQKRTRENPLGLTRRELDVLTLLVEGRRNADIAKSLFVSEKTVDHHVSAVLAKLNVRTRGEAAAAANRLGLLGD